MDWSEEIASVDDETKFTVLVWEDLISDYASYTTGVADSGTASGVTTTITLASALAGGSEYFLQVEAAAVSDATDSNADQGVPDPVPFTADTTAPVLETAEADGSTLTLTYDEALDESSVPEDDDFAVTADGEPVALEGAAQVTGMTVVLALVSSLNGTEATLSYLAGTTPLQDLVGNAAADIDPAVPVDTPASEAGPPTLVAALVTRDFIDLIYSEDLNHESVPDASAFTATVAGAGSTITDVSILEEASHQVRLTLSEAAAPGDSVSLTYAVPGADPLQDLDGELAAAFTDQAVDNITTVVSLSPAAIDYGTSPVGSGVSETITVTNDGPAVLVLDGWSVDGDESWAVGDSTCVANESGLPELAVDESCTIDAVFVPQSVGEHSATFEVLSNSATSPDGVALSGTAEPSPCGQALPSVSQGLANMGFETGDLTDWHLGAITEEVVATQADDFATPWEGSWMARLGSAYASSEDRQAPGANELCQDFVVTTAEEQFAYQIVTYDYTGFDEFQFSLQVTDPATGEVLAAHRQQAWGVDVALKTSGWRGVTLDLADHIGQTVRLTFQSGGTSDDLFPFWVYLDSASDSLPTSSLPAADVGTTTGSVSTDPQTGQVTVSMPFGQPSDLSLTTMVDCGEGVVGTVVLLYGGASYPMTAGSSNTFSATIPADAISAAGNGSLVVNADCGGGIQTVSQLGQVILYDPSGTITDSVTGLPIQGATVTLFKVPGWIPEDENGVGDCQSNESKTPGDPWSQEAPTDLGAQVSAASVEISPNVNPFISNAVGYYGWDVAEGCWYVVVAKLGYHSVTSPVVGVPPAVTDLHVQLAPVATGGGGTGGGSAPTPPAPKPVDGAAADIAGPRARVVLDVEGTLVELRLDGVEGAGQVSVTRLTSVPAAVRSKLVGVASFDLESTVGFSSALVCFGYVPADLERAGITENELRLFHVTANGPTDVTSQLNGSRDRICGKTDSFSPFVLGVERTVRIGGADRVATAAALSAARFPTGTPSAYLATADAFADALAAGPAAARVDAPLLLVTGGKLSDATVVELDRLRVTRVVVLGGSEAIPMAVESQLAALGIASSRVAGPDRYATAAVLSEGTFVAGVREVFVATGENFPDALAGGAAAALRGGPVLLVQQDEIPAVVSAELQRLAPAPDHRAGREPGRKCRCVV